MTRDAEGLVRTFWGQVWLRRQVELVDELFTDPFIRHWHEGTQVISSADYRDRVSDALDRSRSVSVNIDALDVCGDHVWARVSTVRVAVATQQTMSVTWMQQFRVADGRIAEVWALYETGLQWPSSQWGDLS